MFPSDGIPFHFDCTAEVFEKAGDEPGKSRRIGGIISTEHRDQQGEIVQQSGLDYSYFLQNGWLNDNHSKQTAGIVGYPEFVKRTIHKGKPATYFEGYLLENYPRADEIWQLGKSLQKTKRRLGFSVEGSVLRRKGNDGKLVAAAIVRNVAITNCPINDKTNMEVLAKSLSYAQNAPLTDWEKAMLVGATPTPATSPTAPGSFAPGQLESLDRVLNDTSYAAPKKKKRKQQLTKAQAINVVLQRYPNMDIEGALNILNLCQKFKER